MTNLLEENVLNLGWDLWLTDSGKVWIHRVTGFRLPSSSSWPVRPGARKGAGKVEPYQERAEA